MRLLVISDTHGNFPLAVKAHTQSGDVDEVVHLGDGAADADLLRDLLGIPVTNVAGNCDPGSSAPRELVCIYEGRRVLLTHGDAYLVKTGLGELEQRGREVNADAVLFGHSHSAMNESRSDILFVNPGSLARAASPTTYAIVEISTGRITAGIFQIS